jgi:hypothetical protein
MIAWHFIVHWIGGDYGAPAYGYFEPYDLYSGLFGLGILGLLTVNLRKHNCHQRWCWRFGHHAWTDPASGVTYSLCRRHHPDHPGRRPLTGEHIREVHLLHRIRPRGRT